MRKCIVTLVVMFIAIGAFAQDFFVEKVEMSYSSINREYDYVLYLSNGDVLRYEAGCCYDENGLIDSDDLVMAVMPNGKIAVHNLTNADSFGVDNFYQKSSNIGWNNDTDSCNSSGIPLGDKIIIVVLILCACGFVVYITL